MKEGITLKPLEKPSSYRPRKAPLVPVHMDFRNIFYNFNYYYLSTYKPTNLFSNFSAIQMTILNFKYKNIFRKRTTFFNFKQDMFRE